MKEVYHFSSADFIIIGVYFAIIISVGLYFSFRGKNSADYFLASRHMGWFAVGASLFASQVSSEHIVGLASSGSKSGLAVGNFEWLACFIIILLGWFFVPFYLRSGVFTMPEFIEKRFDKRSRWYLAVVSIVAYVVTKLSVTLYAGGIVMKAILGWDVYTSAIFMVIATGIYTIAGGLRAVIYTEIVQMFVLIGGGIALTVYGLVEIGGVEGLKAKAPEGFFEMFLPADHPDFPWTGVVFGAPIIGVWYWCTDQYIVQRVLSARNIGQACAGSLFAGYLKILPVFILVLPGIIARILYPEVASDPNLAYPVLVANILPVGLKGFVIAGLMAALMSSLASTFNSSSTLFTFDIYKKLYPNAPEFRLVNVGRLVVVVMIILGILWVPFIQKFSQQLFVYLQELQGYIAPPITAVFFLGLISSRINGFAAFTTLIFGIMLAVFKLILELFSTSFEPGVFKYIADLNFLHYTFFLFVLSVIMIYSISYFTEKPARINLEGYTIKYFKKSIADDQTSFEENRLKKINIVMSLFLVLIVGVMWYIFR